MPACLPLQLPVYNEHRSDAESLVSAQPVILVKGIKALCDGCGCQLGRKEKELLCNLCYRSLCTGTRNKGLHVAAVECVLAIRVSH